MLGERLKSKRDIDGESGGATAHGGRDGSGPQAAEQSVFGR
jgi:hypothetical protein